MVLLTQEAPFYITRGHVAIVQRVSVVRATGEKVVAHTAGGAFAGAGGHPDFRVQFRNRLGTLSVLLTNAGGAAHPGHLGFLS